MKPSYIDWLSDTGESHLTKDGKTVPVFELNHQEDAQILSEWATHFRNQYCCDSQIDALVEGTGESKADYLKNYKFPDKSKAPGPSIRAGDFAEILAADYLEYCLDNWVPRTRYNEKTVRNESTKGADTIGFYFENETTPSIKDTLTIIESKARYTSESEELLQTAIEHSAKDILRKAESLNAIKQRYLNTNNIESAKRVSRFQNEADIPFTHKFGAIAHLDRNHYSENIILNADASDHPFSSNLFIIVIKGSEMMSLVHRLYETAANES